MDFISQKTIVSLSFLCSFERISLVKRQFIPAAINKRAFSYAVDRELAEKFRLVSTPIPTVISLIFIFWMCAWNKYCLLTVTLSNKQITSSRERRFQEIFTVMCTARQLFNSSHHVKFPYFHDKFSFPFSIFKKKVSNFSNYHFAGRNINQRNMKRRNEWLVIVITEHKPHSAKGRVNLRARYQACYIKSMTKAPHNSIIPRHRA